MNRFGILAFLCLLLLCTGCDNSKKISEQSLSSKAPIQESVINLNEMMNHVISVSEEVASEINLEESDEYVQINNNMINGNFIFSYKKGYLYGCEKEGKEGAEMAIFYNDGKGKIVEQKSMPEQLIYVHDNAIYYHETGSLKCNMNGRIKTIIKSRYSDGNSLFFADKYIYYTDINEEDNKTYIYRVDYEGSHKEKLYIFDTSIDQIYLYENELWFVFYEFQDTEKSGLGKVNCSNNDIAVYKDIAPEGTSEAGNKISIMNGYVYFNSSRFKRLNIQNDTVEELFHANVEGVNFVKDGILFYKDKSLYKRDSDGVKKIRKLKGKTAGFEGIRVENDRIYIQSYEGAYYTNIIEINKQGDVIGTISNNEPVS